VIEKKNNQYQLIWMNLKVIISESSQTKEKKEYTMCDSNNIYIYIYIYKILGNENETRII